MIFAGGHLTELGFRPAEREGDPICRFRTSDDLVLDVMPLDLDILGFTNRWYSYAIDAAAVHQLEPELEIRGVVAPAFLATKWEACRSRGDGNMLTSHDVEDIADSDAEEIVEDALPGARRMPGLVDRVMQRIRKLAG